MTKFEFICNECGIVFSSPQTLGVHAIEKHHPNLILESSPPQPPPPNDQRRPEPSNAQNQPQNAPPQHVQPFDLNLPLNVQPFDLNTLPSSSEEE